MNKLKEELEVEKVEKEIDKMIIITQEDEDILKFVEVLKERIFNAL